MMKEYMTPEMVIFEFDSENVITTSGEPEMDAGVLDEIDL